MRNYYIYIHTRNDTLEPFYVGKGKDKRAFVKSHRTTYWRNIVNKYGYSVTIIESNLTELESLQREIFWISFFGRKDLGNGTLVNLTDGGESTLGYKHTEQSRLQMSISRKGRKNSDKQKMVVGERFKGKSGDQHNRSQKVRCIETGEVYGSQSEAQRKLNLGNGCVSWSIKHKKPIYGMHFEIGS